MSEEKVQLSILAIQNDLKAGLDRDAIAKKYGLKQSEIKEVFKDPKLKGLKVFKVRPPRPPKPSRFVLIDDAPERVSTAKPKAEGENNEATAETQAAPVEATTVAEAAQQESAIPATPVETAQPAPVVNAEPAQQAPVQQPTAPASSQEDIW